MSDHLLVVNMVIFWHLYLLRYCSIKKINVTALDATAMRLLTDEMKYFVKHGVRGNGGNVPR